MLLARLVFNLKAIEFGTFFACFHLLGTLKWYNFSKSVPKHYFYENISDKKNRLKIALQVSKLGFSPIVMLTVVLEIGLLTKITFCLFLKFLLNRIFWWKPCEKIQRRSWYKMPSKLLGCIGFLYKVVHKTGRFSVFISTFSFPFNFPTGNALVLEFGTLPLSGLFSNTFVSDFWYLISFKSYSPFCTEKWAKIDMRACLST